MPHGHSWKVGEGRTLSRVGDEAGGWSAVLQWKWTNLAFRNTTYSIVLPHPKVSKSGPRKTKRAQFVRDFPAFATFLLAGAERRDATHLIPLVTWGRGRVLSVRKEGAAADGSNVKETKAAKSVGFAWWSSLSPKGKQPALSLCTGGRPRGPATMYQLRVSVSFSSCLRWSIERGSVNKRPRFPTARHKIVPSPAASRLLD